jgi:hypothetical protein
VFEGAGETSPFINSKRGVENEKYEDFSDSRRVDCHFSQFRVNSTYFRERSELNADCEKISEHQTFRGQANL